MKLYFLSFHVPTQFILEWMLYLHVPFLSSIYILGKTEPTLLSCPKEPVLDLPLSGIASLECLVIEAVNFA